MLVKIYSKGIIALCFLCIVDLTFGQGSISETGSTTNKRNRKHDNKSRNNATVVLNNCDKKLCIVISDSMFRNRLFIKQSELVNFEIENINPQKDIYKVNSELISYNLSQPDTSLKMSWIKTDEEGTDGKSLSKGPCADMNYIINLDEEVAKYLYKVELNNCPNFNAIKDDINHFIDRMPCSFNKPEQSYNGRILIDKNCKDFFILEKDTIKDLSPSIKSTIRNLENNLKILSNYQDNKISTLPVSITGKNIDLIRYNIEHSVMDKDKKEVYSEKVSYDVYIRGGVKIDYSAGVFLSFLTSKRYRLEDTLINNTTNKKILNDNDDFANLAIGTTVNLNFRWGTTLNPGFSFGMMIPVTEDNISPQIMGGVNLICGKEQRIGISFGVVYGQTKKLTSGYDVNKMYILKENAVPYTSSYSGGFYFGLVYNLKGNKIFEFNK